MKNIRSNLFVAFPIVLLLSGASAHSMYRTFGAIDKSLNPVTTAAQGSLSFAYNFVAGKAGSLWSKAPSRQQVAVATANALDEAGFMAKSALATLPSKAKIAEVADETIVRTLNYMDKHPRAVKVAAAVVAAPVVAKLGVVAYKKATAKPALPTFEETIAPQLEAKRATVDLDVLENVHALTLDIGNQILNYRKARKELNSSKVVGSLNFEKTIEPLIGRVPQTLPELAQAWDDLVAMATAYDRAANDDTLSLVNFAIEKVMDKLEEAYTAAEKQAVKAVEVAPKAVVVEPAQDEKQAESTIANVATIATDSALVGLAAVETGLVDKAIDTFNKADSAVAEKVSTQLGAVINFGLENAYKPSMWSTATNFVKAAFTKAQENKAVVRTMAAAGAGLYGLVKLHNYIVNDESTFSNKEETKVQAPVAQEATIELPEIQPVDSNLQMVGE